MGAAPYIGPKLGDGPILEVSVSQLEAKEHPDKLPTDLHNTIYFSLIHAQLPIESKGSWLSGWYFTVCR
jgi:hypothetical protein